MSTRTSPLRSVHEDLGAKFTTFGGWDMPVEFDSIVEEHNAVREAAGIFDVSHMGQIVVAGPDATGLCQRLLTNDVEALGPGDAQYSMVTDRDGIIIDDTVIYRLPGTEADPRYLFVPNAGHDRELLDRWTAHRDRWGLEASVANETAERAMVAVQGPDAARLVDDAADLREGRASDIGRFSVHEASIDGVDCLIARTGYTGEDGFEVVCPWSAAPTVWDAFDCQPCGLGARDTLRIEAGFLLSGQDFDPEDEPRNPYEARAGFTVALSTEFVGRDALAAIEAAGPSELFVGIVLEERGVPRHGYAIYDGKEPIGTVTSGTMSPTFDEPLGLGYVPIDYADPGTEVAVRIRGDPKKARIENPRFLEERR